MSICIAPVKSSPFRKKIIQCRSASEYLTPILFHKALFSTSYVMLHLGNARNISVLVLNSQRHLYNGIHNEFKNMHAKQIVLPARALPSRSNGVQD